jgi:hypothetical protein
MAKCPKCNHDVTIPFVMRLSGNSWQLTCAYCNAGLKLIRRHSSIAIAGTIAVLVFAMDSETHSVAKVLVLISAAMMLVSVRELRDPQLQLVE